MERQNIGVWEEHGRQDAAQRALKVWKELLTSYEMPPIDPGIEEGLREYIEKRKREMASRPQSSLNKLCPSWRSR